jgi:hypothetical protein
MAEVVQLMVKTSTARMALTRAKVKAVILVPTVQLAGWLIACSWR